MKTSPRRSAQPLPLTSTSCRAAPSTGSRISCGSKTVRAGDREVHRVRPGRVAIAQLAGVEDVVALGASRHQDARTDRVVDLRVRRTQGQLGVDAVLDIGEQQHGAVLDRPALTLDSDGVARRPRPRVQRHLRDQLRQRVDSEHGAGAQDAVRIVFAVLAGEQGVAAGSQLRDGYVLEGEAALFVDRRTQPGNVVSDALLGEEDLDRSFGGRAPTGTRDHDGIADVPAGRIERDLPDRSRYRRQGDCQPRCDGGGDDATSSGMSADAHCRLPPSGSGWTQPARQD